MLKVQELEDKQITAGHIGFILGPCFNAAGRIATVAESFSLLMEEDEEKALEKAERLKEIKELMPHCKETQWNPQAVDIIPATGGKQNGIHEVLKYYSIDQSETMSFGDGKNDIDMFEYTKISVAMGNAEDDVKKAADYVTDDIDEDGLYNALKHFEII